MSKARIHREQVVLAYHKIGVSPDPEFDTWHFIPEHVFRSQLGWIECSDWEVIDHEMFLRGLESPDYLPPKSLLLTFDDGHLSMRQTALSILQEFDYPGVCFVPTDHIGRESVFDDGAEPVEPICSWDDLKKLVAAGIAVQSHGASHKWFSLLDPQELREEISSSKKVLEQGLGRTVSMLAYPYSDAGSHRTVMAEILQQAGYAAAFLCGGGPNKMVLPLEFPFHIDRLPVYRDTNLEEALS